MLVVGVFSASSGHPADASTQQLPIATIRPRENSAAHSINEEKDNASDNRLLVIFQDITSFLARELAKKEAYEKATSAESMWDAMIALTHELRAPLRRIRGVTILLLQHVGDLVLESLELVMTSSGLLLDLIDRGIVFHQECRWNISDVTIDANLAIQSKAIATSNALRLKQVLINLISNAIKLGARSVSGFAPPLSPTSKDSQRMHWPRRRRL